MFWKVVFEWVLFVMAVALIGLLSYWFYKQRQSPIDENILTEEGFLKLEAFKDLQFLGSMFGAVVAAAVLKMLLGF